LLLQPVARADFANVNFGHGSTLYASVTAIFSSTIFFDHAAGPVLCTEMPFEIDRYGDRHVAHFELVDRLHAEVPKASTRALRIAFATR